ncbi:MAG TPA: FG-GAP-like repeat-containing protein [Urbifossiella sp.]|nr:FG-GAP-like repeat-containing protein [Urbifossiella sp.]
MPSPRHLTPRPLRIDRLEDRLTPTVTFQFDYTYDTTGFFSDPARRAVLEQVGRDIGSQLETTPAAIAPGGSQSWTASFFNPATGTETDLPDLSVAAGTLTVFVGARPLAGAEAAEGGYGASAWGGDWGDLAATRGGSFIDWGGSLAFDPDRAWYTGADPTGAALGQIDLYTVASHELGHLLGIGTADRFHALDVGAQFTGPAAEAVYGGPVPLTADGDHFAQSVTAGAEPVSLRPILTQGERYGLSALDYAALADIGWPVAAAAVALPAARPAALVAAGGGPGGSVRLLDATHPTAGATAANTLQPFPGFDGVVRAVTADVNGDGTPDQIMVTGPGGGSLVRVVDGATGADLLPTFRVFEAGYTGGLFVTAADLDGDGKAEVIVSPDQGGGARVVVLRVGGGTATEAADFYGIEDPNFRGGARVTAADVNGDGTPDLVVAAGFGGGPRVAVFDGKTVATGPRRLVSDFFAFDGPDAENLRNGVFVAAGDLDGDGRADLVFGGGPGGGPRVLVLSGAALLADPAAARQAPLADFFASDTSERGGVHPAVKDVNGDGIPDLIIGSGAGVPGQVSVYLGGVGRVAGTGTGPAVTMEPFGTDPLTDGVYVG